MDTVRLKEILQKLPLTLLLGIYLAYLGYDFYQFFNDSQSPLLQKQAQIESEKKNNATLQGKLAKAQEFFKSLEAKKAEIRALTLELQDLKGTLTEKIDVPAFMKMAVTEAKKVGLTVLGIKPSPGVAKEYYMEQPFELGFRGVYVQLLVYLDRLSNVQNIVRVDSFKLAPIGSNSARYVELEGTVQIKAYHYIGSKADDIASRKDIALAAATSGATPAPAPAVVSAVPGSGLMTPVPIASVVPAVPTASRVQSQKTITTPSPLAAPLSTPPIGVIAGTGSGR